MKITTRSIGLLVGIVIAAAILLTIKANPFGTSKESPRKPTPDEIANYEYDREGEAKRLSASQELASRTDDALTIFNDGKPIARFKDISPYECLKNEGCDIWRFGSSRMLQDLPNTAPKPFAMLMYDPGEGGQIAIVGHDGDLFWFDYQLLPGSRYIASGAIQLMHSTSHFILVDWASPAHSTAYKSDLPCEPIKWLSPSRLLANCENKADEEIFIAGEFSSGDDGNWRFVQTGFIDGQNVVDAVVGEKYVLIPNVKGPVLTFPLTRFKYDGRRNSIWDTYPNGRGPRGYERLAK